MSESVGSKHRLVVSEKLWTPWLHPTRLLPDFWVIPVGLWCWWNNRVCLCPSPCTWRGTGCSRFNRTACNENIKTLIQTQHRASSPESLIWPSPCYCWQLDFLKVQRLHDWSVVWETVNLIKAAAKWNVVCRCMHELEGHCSVCRTICSQSLTEERFLIFSFWCVSTKLNVFRFTTYWLWKRSFNFHLLLWIIIFDQVKAVLKWEKLKHLFQREKTHQV